MRSGIPLLIHGTVLLSHLALSLATVTENLNLEILPAPGPVS